MKRFLNEIVEIIKREINYYRIKPTYALLFITYRCTSRCKMCAMWQRKINVNEEMTLEEWKNTIDSLHNIGVRHIEFFGGDALLRKDILVPLITYAHKKGIYTEMPTNCNLLDDTTAIQLVNAGLDDIWISLDGIDETHDEIRGNKGTFSRVDRAIKSIINARGNNNKPRIFINCVISKKNIESFEEVIPYAQDRGIYGIDFEYVGEMSSQSISKTKFNGIHPTPFFISTEDSSVLLNMEEATLLKEKLKNIKRFNKTTKGLRINTSKIDILSKEDIIRGRFPNKRCYICRDWITIDPYGNVIGCLHFNNYHMGNLKESNLSDIWKGNRHMEFINARDRGIFDICNYCSNGAIRNNTPFQILQYKITKRSKE